MTFCLFRLFLRFRYSQVEKVRKKKRGNFIKGEISGAVRKKNMPHCLLVSSLQAVHWCLRKKGKKKIERVTG